MKVSTEDRENFPSFQSCNEVNIAEKIKSCFMEDWSAKCLKPLCEPLPSDDFIHCVHSIVSINGFQFYIILPQLIAFRDK